MCGASALAQLSNQLRIVHNKHSSSHRKGSINKENQSPTLPVVLPQVSGSVKNQGLLVDMDNWWETQSLLPFKPCSSMILSGCSGSGKSSWTFKLLKHAHLMYEGEAPKNILYCYSIHQPLYDEMEQTLSNFTLHQGLPTQSTIEEFSRKREHNIIVVDDLMDQVICSPEMSLLFTQGCHHLRLSTICISQNLLPQGKCARTITLNSWYLVLFKSLRDKSQIAMVSRQIFPTQKNLLSEVYQDAMQEDYGYVIVDLAPWSDEKYRIRTRVFPGEDPIVYIPKKS